MNNFTFPHREEGLQLHFTLKILLYMVVSLVAVLSVIANILEIKIFLRTQNLRSSTNYYITNMAFSDLIFVLSLWVVYSMSGLAVFRNVLTPIICKVSTYLWYLSFSVSVFSLVLISVDRFFATLFPMKVSMMTGKIRLFFIVLTWAFPMAFLSLVFYGVGLSDEVKSPGICLWRGASTLKFASNMTAVALTYLGPLIVIAILNFLIAKSLRTPNPVIQGNSHISTTRLKRNRRIMAMLILMIVFFFSCYTPKFVIIVFFAFKNVAQVYQIFGIFYLTSIFFLPLLNTFLNPIIIFSFSSNYREALKNFLRDVCVKGQALCSKN